MIGIRLSNYDIRSTVELQDGSWLPSWIDVNRPSLTALLLALKELCLYCYRREYRVRNAPSPIAPEDDASGLNIKGMNIVV